MRYIVRYLIIFFFYLFLWPFFVIKKIGNLRIKKFYRTIIVANHFSNIDPMLIYMVFGFTNKLVFITDERVKKNFFTRIFCWCFNCLYVSRDANKNIELLKKAKDVLKSGKNIVIFPEGVINPSKNCFFEFSRSFCYLSRMTQGKVLPLYIYPEFKPFKKNYLYIGNFIDYKVIEECHDDEIAAMKIQAKIMDYKVIVDSKINLN